MPMACCVKAETRTSGTDAGRPRASFTKESTTTKPLSRTKDCAGLAGQLRTLSTILAPIDSASATEEPEKSQTTDSLTTTARYAHFGLIHGGIHGNLTSCLILKAYGKDDTIGCLIDLDLLKFKWFKNGVDLGYAYDIPQNMKALAFFPSVCMKNAEIKFNFGDTAFKYPQVSFRLSLSKAWSLPK